MIFLESISFQAPASSLLRTSQGECYDCVYVTRRRVSVYSVTTRTLPEFPANLLPGIGRSLERALCTVLRVLYVVVWYSTVRTVSEQ